MKKNLLLSGIAALAILGLVGCNSQEPVQSEPTEKEQQEQPAEQQQEQPAEQQPEEKKE